MEESRAVTPWVNRFYFELPRASSFLGLRLVKARYKNLVPLLSGVKPNPMVGSGRYAEPIPVKYPIAHVSKRSEDAPWHNEPIMTLPVSRALAELSFLGQIGHSKFGEMLTVCGHRTVTAALTRVVFHISNDKYFCHSYTCVINVQFCWYLNCYGLDISIAVVKMQIGLNK